MIANRDNELGGTRDSERRDSGGAGGDVHSVVAVFDSEDRVRRAYLAMQEAGYSEDRLSVVARGTEAANAVLAEDASDQAATKAAGAAATGGVTGGTLAWVAGVSALAIPGIGPILAIAGGALVGAAAGGWLGSIGIAASPDVEERYGELVRQGKFLLFVSTEDGREAQSISLILNEAGAKDVDSFAQSINPSDIDERPGAQIAGNS